MLFASLHSSKRKFPTVQYVNKERFLSPYLYSLFVIRSSLCRCSSPFGGSQRKLGMCKGEVSFAFSLSARATCTVFCSLFVRSFFCLTFPLLHSLSLGEGWGEDIFFVLCLSACRATTSHRH